MSSLLTLSLLHFVQLIYVRARPEGRLLVSASSFANVQVSDARDILEQPSELIVKPHV